MRSSDRTYRDLLPQYRVRAAQPPPADQLLLPDDITQPQVCFIIERGTNNETNPGAYTSEDGAHRVEIHVCSSKHLLG